MTSAVEVINQPGVVVEVNIGNTGNPGLSAYAVAIQNGFVGSEAEWLASLAVGSLPISEDAGNALTFGLDFKLYVPNAVEADGGVDLTLIFENQII
jgi:hypothetical protein